MHHLRSVFFIPATLFLVFFYYSCNDGFEDYSKNPNDTLTFSTDTIAFDTIISSINTPFKVFIVHNRHAKDLLISSISLEKMEESDFKINVDGRAGYTFNNIEIKANDSIYVFVNAKPQTTGSNTPQYITDHILFQTNGIVQKVLVEAAAQDVVIWKGMVINSDTTLPAKKPYLIYDSLVVGKDVRLTLLEGTTLFMHGNAEIIVKGQVNIQGSLDKPVIIRGDRFDEMVNISYDLIPGQWGGIRFDAGSYNNTFEYVSMRNGNFGMDFQPSDPFISKIILKNVTMTNFKGTLIHAVNCNIEAYNCEFSNAQKALLDLTGGTYSFTHCTMANHYFSSNEYGWGNSDNETIILRNKYQQEESDTTLSIDYTINRADFYNCIVWGAKDRTTSGIVIDQSEGATIRYLFENCLIPNGTNDPEGDIDATVVNCIIGKSPEFSALLVDEDNTVNFIYDFRLTKESPARNVANRTIAQLFPLDKNGMDRLRDEGPDIGAYEWIQKTPEEIESTNP